MSRTARLITGSLLALVVMVGSSCTTSTEKSSETTTTAEKASATTSGQPATTAKDKPAKKKKDEPAKKKKDEPKKAPTGVSGSFCDMAKGYEDVITENMFGGLSLEDELDEAEVFENFKSGMNEVFDYLKDMAKVAPGELKADMKLMIDASDEYMDAINSATSMDDEKLKDLDKTMDSPELTAASDRMEKYWEDRCGVEPMGSTFPDGS